MKKTLLVAALMLGASSASAYEVHKNVPINECNLIEGSLLDKGYSRFNHKFTHDWHDVNGTMFSSFYVNSDSGKVFGKTGLVGPCHIFIGTVDDLQKFRDAKDLAREKRIEAGKSLASKYGL